MKLGLALPTFPFSFPPGSSDRQPVAVRAIEYARVAETIGFHQVWVPDHLWIDVAPPGATPLRQQPPECWSLLAALAVATTSIRLGSLVTPIGFRNLTLLSRAVSTVQHLAGGRLDVGLGAGWNAAEFAEAGLAFPSARERLESLRSAVTLLRAGEDAPVVWVGGRRPRLLEVAAVADGWNTAWDTTPERYAALTEAFDATCRRTHRNPGSVRRSVGLVTLLGSSDDDVVQRWQVLRRWAPGSALDHLDLANWAGSRLVGTAAQVASQLRGWADAGVDQVILAFGAPFAVFQDEQLELAAEVIASVS